MKIKGRKSEFDSDLEIAWSPSYLKRSSYFKIQSPNSRSENRFSDGWTRESHSQKCYCGNADFSAFKGRISAALWRQMMPRFGGGVLLGL